MKLMMDKGVIGFIEIQAILQSVKDEARQNNWTDLQTEMRYQEVLWSDRLSLREQIARKILAKCENKTETNTSEFGSYEVVGCLEFIQLEDTAYYEVTCTHAEDAAIAGGDKE